MRKSMMTLLAVFTLSAQGCGLVSPERDLSGEWEGYVGAGRSGTITIETGAEGQVYGHDESGPIWGQYLHPSVTLKNIGLGDCDFAGEVTDDTNTMVGSMTCGTKRPGLSFQYSYKRK